MKLFFPNRLRNKLILTYIVMIVIVVAIVGTASLRISKEAMKSEVGNSRVELLNQIGKNVLKVTGSIEAISNVYYFDPAINSIIGSNSKLDSSTLALVDSNLRSSVSNYQYAFDTFEYNTYATICGYNGLNFSTYSTRLYKFDALLKADWIKDVEALNGKIFWTPVYNDINSYGKNKYIFTAARLIKHSISSRPLGILFINTDKAALENVLSTGDKSKSNIFIADKKGNLIFSSQDLPEKTYLPQLISSGNKGWKILSLDGVPNIVSYYSLSNPDWVIVEEYPLTLVNQKLSTIYFIIFASIISCVAIGVLLSVFISSRISSPVKLLYNSMVKFNGDGNTPIINTQSKDEIGYLSSGFNQMSRRITNLIEDIRKEEFLKKRAELDCLQAEINPHFLFNTLYSIKCMISLGQNEKANHMIMAFMSLLRKTLSGNGEFISIGSEMENLNNYVSILQCRYENNIHVEYDIDNAIMDHKLLKLILQPIIENAIFHGIEPLSRDGFIHIRGVQTGGDLVFTVSDNGIGMEEATIKKVLQDDSPQGEGYSGFSNIGISNVDMRLKLYFGSDYGVGIRSEIGSGTTVTLKMKDIL